LRIQMSRLERWTRTLVMVVLALVFWVLYYRCAP